MRSRRHLGRSVIGCGLLLGGHFRQRRGIVGGKSGVQRPGRARDLRRLPERGAAALSEAGERAGVREERQLVGPKRAARREIFDPGEGRSPLLFLDALARRLPQARDETKTEPDRSDGLRRRVAASP
jgi:hypothetical protein